MRARPIHSQKVYIMKYMFQLQTHSGSAEHFLDWKKYLYDSRHIHWLLISWTYRFKCIDLDGNGIITSNEMQFFYEEQLHRMECMAQEPVLFEDILCQMVDMIGPEVILCIFYTFYGLISSQLASENSNILTIWLCRTRATLPCAI